MAMNDPTYPDDGGNIARDLNAPAEDQSQQPDQDQVNPAPQDAPAGTVQASTFTPDGTPLDATRVVEAPSPEPQPVVTAAATDPSTVNLGPGGRTLPQAEIGGGNVARELTPPAPVDTTASATALLQRAAGSSVAQRLAGFVGRPLNEWGLIGHGAVIRGHNILIDLETGEKVRAHDGAKLEDNKVYANSRNFPQWLVDGDMIEKILAGKVPS